MLCTVNGFNTIKSKKDGKEYTIVHVTTDIPFSNGGGCQNLEFFQSGKVGYSIGEVYEAVTETFLAGNELKTRVVGLADVK